MSELLVLFGSAFISSTIAPGGSEIVLVTMQLDAVASVPVLLLTATLGNSLGALTTVTLGMLAASGRMRMHEKLKQHDLAITRLRNYGAFLLLFSWLPVIGDGLCFAAGWLRMAWLPMVLCIVIGKLLRYAFLLLMVSAI